MSESSFWDHSQRWVWKWFFQMLCNRNVFFFYDFKKKCYVRKVTHVKGEITIDPETWRRLFRPYANKIVNYNQLR